MRKLTYLALTALLMGCVRTEMHKNGLTGTQSKVGDQLVLPSNEARLTGPNDNLLANQLSAQAGGMDVTNIVGETALNAPAAMTAGDIRGKTRSNLTEHTQADTLAFKSPEYLANEYKNAVSIEIRVKDNVTYESAKKFYEEAISSSFKFNAHSTSWDYKTPEGRRLEILLINVPALTGKMSSKADQEIIAFVELDRKAANSRKELMAVNKLLSELYGITVTEDVDEGPVGPRDVSIWRNAVRTVLGKPKELLISPNGVKNKVQQYDGVIINPPVP